MLKTVFVMKSMFSLETFRIIITLPVEFCIYFVCLELNSSTGDGGGGGGGGRACLLNRNETKISENVLVPDEILYYVVEDENNKHVNVSYLWHVYTCTCFYISIRSYIEMYPPEISETCLNLLFVLSEYKNE